MRGFKNFKGSDARCPSIHFLFYGAGITDNSLPVATKALDMYMAVSVNSNWKIPCSYFFVNGLTGEQKAHLTKDCLRNLH